MKKFGLSVIRHGRLYISKKIFAMKRAAPAMIGPIINWAIKAQGIARVTISKLKEMIFSLDSDKIILDLLRNYLKTAL